MLYSGISSPSKSSTKRKRELSRPERIVGKRSSPVVCSTEGPGSTGPAKSMTRRIGCRNTKEFSAPGDSERPKVNVFLSPATRRTRASSRSLELANRGGSSSCVATACRIALPLSNLGPSPRYTVAEAVGPRSVPLFDIPISFVGRTRVTMESCCSTVNRGTT